MFEVEVHQQLRSFLREFPDQAWPHHLTMARLVARALRLGRSSLIHLGTAGGHTAHRLSYLMALLLWPRGAVLVAPEGTLQEIMAVDLPPLQAWLQGSKSVQRGDRWPHPDFTGLLLTPPGPWLVANPQQPSAAFPSHLPTLIEGIDDLEAWFIQHHTLRIQPQDWQTLALAFPQSRAALRDVQVRLTHTLFQRPAKESQEIPGACLLDSCEQVLLQDLLHHLVARAPRAGLATADPAIPGAASSDQVSSGRTSSDQVSSDQTSSDQVSSDQVSSDQTSSDQVSSDRGTGMTGPAAQPLAESWPPNPLPEPWHSLQMALAENQGMALALIDRTQGSFSLEWSPLNIAERLARRWPQQPVVLLRETLAEPTQGAIDRGRLGLGEQDLTVVQFNRDRQTEQVQLYLPDHLPLPNTPHFYPALLVELRRLLTLSVTAAGFTVILVNDRPLKGQVGATLAAEFGSRVQIERLPQDSSLAPILVSGWDFWRQQQQHLPNPQLLIMATLPLPSLEDPRVAGRVAYYKHRRQDWFRCYLLPQALVELQRAIAPVRRSQGVVALLDLRVLRRSYGQQILTMLSPMARLGYLDPSLFNPQSCLVEAPKR